MFDLNAIWYQNRVVLWPLIPVSKLFSFAVWLRQKLYQKGFLLRQRFPIPVIVVGNLTVGGTGKTPLVIHIVEFLQQNGFRPGVISRGYRGALRKPVLVTAVSNPKWVGDEAVLLAKRLQCPVMVGKNRRIALNQLMDTHEIDVVVSDDGLQHYALDRHVEIAVVDGQRRFGNQYCLPVGPLREPIKRLNSVDLVVNNGGTPVKGEYSMECIPDELYKAQNSDLRQHISQFQGTTVHAVAGIGNPNRFIQMLRSEGLTVIPHIYPDHHRFKPKDILFQDSRPVIMTEKDAVKCLSFVDYRHWVLPIQAVVNPIFDSQLLTLVKGF